MTVACAKWKITLPNNVIRGRSGVSPASKTELFVTLIYSWEHLTTVAKSSILDDSTRLDADIVNMILQLLSRLFPSWIAFELN